MKRSSSLEKSNTKALKSLENTPIKDTKKPPRNWEKMYHKIKEWRDGNIAPVDTMGCNILAESDISPAVFRYQTLVALQLSSQTKDQVTAEAMHSLKAHPDGGLTVDSVLRMEKQLLNSYISKVGFHNRKTEYLYQTALILKRDYNSDIPRDLQDILKLPGVGPKMAYLLLQCAWDSNEGIGVDTHVHRISNRSMYCQSQISYKIRVVGFVKSTKNPEQTRVELQDWLPSTYWGEINHLLVGFGQLLCKPIGPNCDECPIKDDCPKMGVTRSPKKG